MVATTTNLLAQVNAAAQRQLGVVGVPPLTAPVVAADVTSAIDDDTTFWLGIGAGALLLVAGVGAAAVWAGKSRLPPPSHSVNLPFLGAFWSPHERAQHARNLKDFVINMPIHLEMRHGVLYGMMLPGGVDKTGAAKTRWAPMRVDVRDGVVWFLDHRAGRDVWQSTNLPPAEYAKLVQAKLASYQRKLAGDYT
jgi:hypothetical protein